MPEISIRPARPADAGKILDFIRELATYERAADEVIATEAQLAGSLFGTGAISQALICEQGGKALGFAVYFFSYSTWLARRGLYLEDLYVTPTARGLGAGKSMLRELARIAVANDCGRFEWSVLDWNEPAIRFYESLGATAQAEWIRYRVDGDALRRLAETS